MTATRPACMLTVLFGTLTATAAESRYLPTMKLSANQRFLVTVAGRPLFCLGVAEWERFHRPNREEVRHDLDSC